MWCLKGKRASQTNGAMELPSSLAAGLPPDAVIQETQSATSSLPAADTRDMEDTLDAPDATDTTETDTTDAIQKPGASDTIETTDALQKHGGGQCPICLGDANDDDFATGCGHVFHLQCVSKWKTFCKSNCRTLKCPVCRKCLSETFEVIEQSPLEISFMINNQLYWELIGSNNLFALQQNDLNWGVEDWVAPATPATRREHLYFCLCCVPDFSSCVTARLHSCLRPL